jgi:hypothetical protein
MAPSAAEVAAQFQARPAAGAVVPWEEPSAAAARWERPVSVAAAVRSMAPSAAEVAAQFQARPAAGAVVPWEEPSAAAARWERPVSVAAAARSVVPPAAEVAAQLPAHPADAVAVPWAALFVVAVAARSKELADGGDRHAVLARPRAAAAGSVAARSKGRVAAVAAGLPVPAAVAAARPGPAVAGRGGVRPGAPRGAPAPPAPVARLGRVAAAHFEPAVSPEQRVAASEPGVVSVVFARVAARPEAVALLGAAPAAWASALQPAAVRACRAFRALQPAL